MAFDGGEGTPKNRNKGFYRQKIRCWEQARAIHILIHTYIKARIFPK